MIRLLFKNMNIIKDNLGLMIIAITLIIGLYIINRPMTWVCSQQTDTTQVCYQVKK